MLISSPLSFGYATIVPCKTKFFIMQYQIVLDIWKTGKKKEMGQLSFYFTPNRMDSSVEPGISQRGRLSP